MKLRKIVLANIFLQTVCSFALPACRSNNTNASNNEIQLTMDNYLYYLSTRTETTKGSYSSETITYFSGSSHYLYHNCILYYTGEGADTSKPGFKYEEIHLSISGVGQYQSGYYVSTLSVNISIRNVIKKVSGTVERVTF